MNRRWWQRRRDEALTAWGEALGVVVAFAHPDGSPAAIRALAGADSDVGSVLAGMLRLDEAATYFETCVALLDTPARVAPIDTSLVMNPTRAAQ